MKRKFKFKFQGEELIFDIELENKKIKIFLFYKLNVVLTTMVIIDHADKKYNQRDKWNINDVANLQVNFEERCYSSERISNTINKREGKSSHKSIITSRLIDKCLRTIFENNLFFGMIQINNYVLSIGNKCDPKVMALWNSSLCCLLSEDLYFFKEAIASTKITVRDKKIFINEVFDDDDNENEINIILSSTKEQDIISLDLSSNEQSYENVKKIIMNSIKINSEMIDFFVNIFDSLMIKKKINKLINDNNEEFINEISKKDNEIKKILYNKNKKWEDKQKELDFFVNGILDSTNDENNKKKIKKFITIRINFFLKKLMEDLAGENLRLESERKIYEIREIEINNNFLPIKGNCLFSRGKTETLSVVTIGKISEKKFDIAEKKNPNFINHYNFLPYAGTDISFRGINNSRREIGHSKLIEKSFFHLIPIVDIFPYTIRIISEVISSDGSSSQASICSSSLSLFLSGVPIKRLISGISFGIIGNKILWDITAIEDKFGEMDFKIAGTKEGICSAQLDTKKKISLDNILKVLSISHLPRLIIIEKMEKSLEKIPKDKKISKNKKIFVSEKKANIIDNYIPKIKENFLKNYGSDIKIQKNKDSNFVVIYNEDENNLELSYKILMNKINELIG